jgi:soluble lytic murein transglycosylase-like protein
MEIITLIMSAAKAAGVSGVLLLAICNHESGGFRMNYAPMDVGSPSFGSCQLKYNTSLMLGFPGMPIKLMDPRVNAAYAAKYLSYQQKRYGDNWVKLAGAYNAGSFLPSKKVPGCPKNLGYIKSVQKKLPEELQERLDCGISRELADSE